MRKQLKYLFDNLLYRHIQAGLAPERLYLYLKYLILNKNVEGEILEVGSDMCGTSIMAKKMLNNLGIDRQYYCIDTFSGFVKYQFELDLTLGTVES